MTIIKGETIEKGGINVSTVSGEFSKKMQKRIPGADINPAYNATGISVVLHPKSPLIPSMHFNTRFLSTSESWFGGGMDITPANSFEEESKFFHTGLKKMCDRHDIAYYEKYKKWCDEYFFLKHRNEARGIGGIFFDNLHTDNVNNDFNFVKDVGIYFNNYIERIINKYKDIEWSEADKHRQLLKRGRYVEFNLLYDRGTKFGLETGGNTDAILMSMPPLAVWE